MFYEVCDGWKEFDWAVALQQLVEILEEAFEKTSKKLKNFIKCQLQQRFASMPNYIKPYLPIFKLRKFKNKIIIKQNRAKVGTEQLLLS